jgi:hypothetical protein
MGKILVVDDTGEIIIVDNAAAISEVIKKDLLPHLPLPEIESHVPTNKEPNWKKKKYFGKG